MFALLKVQPNLALNRTVSVCDFFPARVDAARRLA